MRAHTLNHPHTGRHAYIQATTHTVIHINTYMHTYIHTDAHTHIRTHTHNNIHTCILADMQPRMPAYGNAYTELEKHTHTYIHSGRHTYSQPGIQAGMPECRHTGRHGGVCVCAEIQ